MAKKGNRIIIHLVCDVCGEQNYTTTINKQNTELKDFSKSKFCPRCRKQTTHAPEKKLK